MLFLYPLLLHKLSGIGKKNWVNCRCSAVTIVQLRYSFALQKYLVTSSVWFCHWMKKDTFASLRSVYY